MCNSKHGTLIKKITGNFESDDDDVENKFDIIAEEKTSEEVLEDKINFDDENQLNANIKKETQDTNKTSNENDPVQEIILRNEKKITVARKRKKSETLIKKIEPSYKVTEDLKCRVCSEVLPNVRVFHTHMNRHFPNHICETCGKGEVFVFTNCTIWCKVLIQIVFYYILSKYTITYDSSYDHNNSVMSDIFL